MHILHVEKMLFSPSGVTSCVRRLTQLQRAIGHEVSHFSCADSAGQAGLPEFFDFTATRNPLALARMVHNTEAANLLERFLRCHRVDVAHLHNLYHHLTPSILPVLARHGIAMVMTVHDYRLACPTKHFLRPDGLCMRCLPNRFYHAASPRCAGAGGAGLAIESLIQRFFRRYIRWIDFFLCPGEFLRNVLVRTGLPASKCLTMPSAVNTPVLPAEVTRQKRRLLYVGRLSWEKGPDLMLDVAAALPDAEFVMVGGGPMLQMLKNEIDRRGLINVTLTGPVAHQEVGRYYAAATAVVLPSRCYENSPQAMLEAMSASRCVIVPGHPSLRQWVTDGKTGRAFVPGDAKSLAAVASDVLNDAALRSAMERAAAELLQQNHDAGTIVRQLDGIYQEARRRCALRW